MPRALIVEIFGDARQFAKEMDKAAGKTRRLGKAAGVAGAALGGAFLLGAEKAVKGAMEDQVQMSRLTQAFKDAHVPIKSYSKQIDAAQESGRKLGFVDEDVVKSLGSLITATKNGKKAFDLLGVAQDLSRFKHIDLESATKKLTSAMAGNVRAAKELGIRIPKDITDPQKKAAFVIEEVRKRVHGQAAAFAGTAEGGIAKYKARMDEVKDSIGKGLLPAFEFLVGKMAKVAEFFAKHQTLAKVLFVAIGVLSGALLVLAASTWAVNVAMDANPLGLVVLAIAALVAAIVIAVKHWDDIKAAMSAVWDWIKGTFLGIWDTLKDTIGGVTDKIKEVFSGVVDWLKDHWVTLVVAIFTGLPGLLIKAVIDNWDTFAAPFKKGFELVKNGVLTVAGAIVTFFTELPGKIWDGFKSGWETAKTSIGGAFDWVKTHASEVVTNAANFFKDLPGKIVSAISGAMGDLKKGLEDLFSWKKIVGWIKGALGFGSPSPHFMAIGHDIVDSMVRGVGQAAGLLKNAVVSLAKKFIPSFSAPSGGGEPSGSGPITGSGHLVGRVLNALQYARRMGWHGDVISGFRTYQEQAALYKRYVDSGFNPRYIAAKPGTSSHEKGEAVDVSDASRFDSIMAAAPNDSQLYNNVPGDFSHFSVSGRALGGAVAAGMPYIVGEKGRELFVPGQSGQIVANHKIGGGDTIIHNVIELDGKVAYESWKKQAGRDVGRNGGTGVRS